MKIAVSIVIPVFNEDKNIQKVLSSIHKKVKLSYEIIVIFDRKKDTTIPVVRNYISSHKSKNIFLVQNNFGNKKGVMNAIKSGFKKAKGDAIVVTMADLSDDVSQINNMYALIKKGNDIVCASRFMKKGKKIGGPFLKTLMSRLACFTLFHFCKIPTHDATNAFKMYKKSILRSISIESTQGFEYSLEIIAKAYTKGYKITEIPTVWKDREAGKSNFKILSWLPNYLKWYFYLCKFSFYRNRIYTKIMSNAFFWQLVYIFIGIFLTILQVGEQIKTKAVLSSSLDFSWQSDAVERFLHGFIAGKDYIFTYGILFQIIYSLPSLMFKVASYTAVLLSPIVLICFVVFLLIFLTNAITKNWLERIIIPGMLLIIIGLADASLGNTFVRILVPLVFAAFWIKENNIQNKIFLSFLPAIFGLYSFDLLLQTFFLAIALSAFQFLFDTQRMKNLITYILSIVTIGLSEVITSIIISHNLDYIQYSLATIHDYYYLLNIFWENGRAIYLFIFPLFLLIIFILLFTKKQFSKEQKNIFFGLVVTCLLSLRIALIRSDSGHIEESLFPSIIVTFIFLTMLIKNKSIFAIAIFFILYPLIPFKHNYYDVLSIKNIKSVITVIKTNPSFFSLYRLPDGYYYSQNDFLLFKDLIRKNPQKVMVYPYDTFILNIYHQTYNTFPLQFYAYSNSSVEKKAVELLTKNPPKYIILGIDNQSALALDNIPNFTRNSLVAQWMIENYAIYKEEKKYLVLVHNPNKTVVQNSNSNCIYYIVSTIIPNENVTIKPSLYYLRNSSLRVPYNTGKTTFFVFSQISTSHNVSQLFLSNKITLRETQTKDIGIYKVNPFSPSASLLFLPAKIDCYL